MNEMTVRLLEKEERFPAELISTTCFHGRISDEEAARKKCESKTDEDWGAFSGDGTLMAHIINNHFESWLDGQVVMNGGIGAVSTLPEYRESGAIRHIFEKLLPEAYRRGEVISTLYPFNHAFYRKFGYETLVWNNRYEFSPEVLRGYRFTGTVSLFQTGDAVGPYFKLYTEFAKRHNLAIVRDEERMLSHLKGVWFEDRKFSYLLSDEKGPAAYLIFQDIRHDPQAILSVKELAYSGRRGFEAILGFLSRFTADYGTIRLELPAGTELLSVIRSPKAYEIQRTVSQNYMIRVIHADKLLSMMRMPENTSFVIRVTDDLLKENLRTFRVRKGSAVETTEKPDLSVSVQALGQMAVGGTDLQEAMLRPDVEVFSNEEVLRQVFVKKPLYLADYF